MYSTTVHCTYLPLKLIALQEEKRDGQQFGKFWSTRERRILSAIERVRLLVARMKMGVDVDMGELNLALKEVAMLIRREGERH